MPVIFKPPLLQAIPENQIELIPVPVALMNQVLIVRLVGVASGFKVARVSAESHRAPFVRRPVPFLHAFIPVDPLLHQVDDRVRCVLIELRAVCSLQFCEVSRNLYDGKLHAQTYPEDRGSSSLLRS